MPKLVRVRKGRQPIVSKQESLSIRKLSVTDSKEKAINVTCKSKEKPFERCRQLRRWLDLANLLPFEPDSYSWGSFLPWQALNPDDANQLRAAFDKQFGSLPIKPTVFFQLRISNRRLEEAYKVTRCFLESVPTMDWESQAAEVSFPIPHYATADAHGRIVLQAEQILGIFKTDIEGAEIRRFGRCPICGKFFYAVRVTQQACSQRCNATRRVRAWREKQHEYE